MQSALELCINARYVFKNVNTVSISNMDDAAYHDITIVREKTTEEKIIAHISVFEKRLQLILRTLIRSFTNLKDPKNHIVLYKNMYMETLKNTKAILSQVEVISNAIELGTYYFSLLQKLYQLDYKWECVDKYQVKDESKDESK